MNPVACFQSQLPARKSRGAVRVNKVSVCKSEPVPGRPMRRRPGGANVGCLLYEYEID
jgi:hypothetical protein